MSQQTPQSLEARIITRALQDASFKQQLLSGAGAAKAAIEQEIGRKLPEDLQVNVLEETANVSYIVLPAMASNQEMSEKQLEAVAGGKADTWTKTSGATAVISVTVNSLPCTMDSASIHF